MAKKPPAPVNREELTTAAATIQSDPALIYSVWMGSLAIQTEDPVLITQGGFRRWEVYQELLQDPHVFAVWSKRIRALQAYDWEVIPASAEAGDKEAAAEVRRQFGAVGFDRVTEVLMDGIWKGFVVGEVLWEYDGVRYCVKNIKAVPQRRIRFRPTEESAWEMRLLTHEDAVQGVAVPDRKFLHFAWGSDSGNPYGHGLGSRAWWPVFFKKAGIKFWLIFAEKYGTPTAVGKAPRGAKQPARDKLLKALSKIAQDSGIVIDEDEAVSLLEASKSGAIDAYEKLVRLMDEQVSELVLGETGSTNQSGGGGSRARDEVGNEVRLEVAQADSDLLCDGPFQLLAKWITEVNFPAAKPPTVRRVVESPKDLRSIAERDERLFQMGWERTDESIREVYGEGFQRRKGGAIGKTTATITEAVEPGAVPTFAEGQGGQSMPSESMRALSASLMGAAPAAMAQLMTGVETILDESTSLTDFQERLMASYADLPVGKMRRLVEEGTLAAQLVGRAEVGNG